MSGCGVKSLQINELKTGFVNVRFYLLGVQSASFSTLSAVNVTIQTLFRQ